MSNFTPAQLKQLQTWADQRDSLLREIGVYTVERDDRKKEAEAQGLALADLHRSISEANGRISELSALEDRTKNSVSIEVAELVARKSRLEGECEAKESELEAAKDVLAAVVSSTAELSAVHNIVKDQAAIVGSVLGSITDASITHLSDAKGIIAEIRTISAEVVEKANKNLEQTNIIIEKLPKYIFELQRPIPVRRRYPDGHPNATVIGAESTIVPPMIP